MLTALAGVVVVVLALRAAPLLSSRLAQVRRPPLLLWVVAGAAALLLVASQAVEVSAALSRVSTPADALGEFATLLAISSIGLALYLRNRLEREVLSSLTRAANVDYLTGLGSRSFFHRAGERRVELCRRNGLPLACLMLDVDGAKVLNDRYGHAAGDEALRCVARALRESTRADDVVARYGGDEFVVLMGGDVEDAVEVAQRVRERVASLCGPERGAHLPRPVTVSLGIASLGEGASATLERLVEAADAELYRAKKEGGHRVAAIVRGRKASAAGPSGGEPLDRSA